MHPASPRGFAAVARDHAAAALDLHELIVVHPAATFFMRMRGDAMTPLIHAGDLLVVDRSLTPRPGRIVVASVDGRWLTRRWEQHPAHGAAPHDGRTCGGTPRPSSAGARAPWDIVLRAENPRYPALRPDITADLRLFGVVTWIARRIDEGGGHGGAADAPPSGTEADPQGGDARWRTTDTEHP